MNQRYDLRHLTDEELEAGLDRLVKQRNKGAAEIIAYIAEFERRKLYAERACSSTFAYCGERLHLSESMAYKHIRVARLALEFPLVFDLLRVGDVHVSNLMTLAPHLTEANHRELLPAAKHLSKRQLALLVAERFPSPDVSGRVRKLPTPRAAKQSAPPPVVASAPTPTPATTASDTKPFALTPPPRKPGKVEPLAPARFKFEFTGDQQLYDDVEKARELMGPNLPRGELSELFGRAMRLWVENLEKKKCAKTSRPQRAPAKPKTSSPDGQPQVTRHVPAEIKRAVYERDGGQCTFCDENGNRCQQRWGLEFHHIDAFALTPKTVQHVTAEEITLHCRPHNQLMAERDFGAEFMAQKRAEARPEPRQKLHAPSPAGEVLRLVRASMARPGHRNGRHRRRPVEASPPRQPASATP